MNGIIVIDKYGGPTSRSIVLEIKKILGVSKAGHLGTLDPLATGVLPIFLDKATKLIDILSRSDKTYIAKMRIHKYVDTNEIKNVMKKFTGVIEQIPPVRSAVKREKRKRKIYEIKYLSRQGNIIEFSVKCEAGTYIRKLIHDMGLEIGGAHMVWLRRVQAGPFKIEDAISIKKLKELKKEIGMAGLIERNIIKSVNVLKNFCKKVYIKKTAEFSITHGSPIFLQGVLKSDKLKKGELFLILSHDGEILGLGEFVGKKIFAKIKSILELKNKVSDCETKL